MNELILPRRRFLLGAASLLAAPAVIRVAKLMPISVERVEYKKLWRVSYYHAWPTDQPMFSAYDESLIYATEREVAALRGLPGVCRFTRREIRAEKHTVSVLLPRTEISL